MKYLDLYKLLNKSNCRDCGLPTCMAFAHSVIKGEKRIGECPHFDKQASHALEARIAVKDPKEEYIALIEELKKAVSGADFMALADGLGGSLSDDRLCINSLGKDFLVGTDGSVESVCHIHLWVHMPLLTYIKTGADRGLSGKWVSFEELNKGTGMLNFFNRRCLEPLKQIADTHTDIFFDLLDIFGGRKNSEFSSDYSRIIYPLPRVPFLVLYWKPEDHFESNLKILFDSTADSYLNVDAIYVLGRGIVEMLKKIIAKHEELLPSLLAL